MGSPICGLLWPEGYWGIQAMLLRAGVRVVCLLRQQACPAFSSGGRGMARVLALPVPRVVVPRATGKYLLVILLLVVVGFLTAYPTFLIFMKSFQITRPGEATVWGLKGWEAAFTDPGG